MKSDFQWAQDNGFRYLVSPEGHKLKIDFDENRHDYFRKGLSKQNLIAKALGLSSGAKNADGKVAPKNILDLTAGLGIDAVHLSCLGCIVTSLERHDLIFELLQQALQKTRRPELQELVFVHADALEFLKTSTEKFDAIYFDPMYPEKKKTALPRKEMQMFKKLVGVDEDVEKVLDLCWKQNVDRVVVKRPLSASILPSTGALFQKQPVQYKGTTVRYDVYLKRKEK